MADANTNGNSSSGGTNATDGTFVWYECMTDDVDKAKAFYTELIGWGTEEMDMGEMGTYTMFTAGGKPVGGLMALPEEAKKMGAPPHWLAYVGVPDVDAGAGRVADLGGEVLVPPTDIPTIGRFSVIKDPAGAVFALFKGVDQPTES